jgi:hypothetical protein
MTMKLKKTVNLLIVGFILLIVYTFVGQDFVSFYFGGKTDLVETATRINQLCNANGACPTTLDGWQPRHSGRPMLSKGKLLYILPSGEGPAAGEPQSFRLVYSFFMPDHWFEARGGVGRQVTADWQSR